MNSIQVCRLEDMPKPKPCYKLFTFDVGWVNGYRKCGWWSKLTIKHFGIEFTWWNTQASNQKWKWRVNKDYHIRFVFRHTCFDHLIIFYLKDERLKNV